MLSWINDTVGNITAWMGDGVASLFGLFFDGLASIVTKYVDAAGGFWDVLDAIWNFAIGFKDSVLALFTTLFPFVPEPVASTIGLGLLAVLIAGIVKKRRL